MSLKLTATSKTMFTDQEGEKKEKKIAKEVPRACGRFKCLAKRWYCSSLWDFQNPSEEEEKNIEKQNG